MNAKLFFEAITKFFFGIVIVGMSIFIPANSFGYWNGWLLMGLLFIPMFVAGVILMFKNPELLQRRLDAKEKEMEQKYVVVLSGVMFLTGFIIAGLNYRYGWTFLPNVLVIMSSFIFIIAYILYAEILRENAFLSRTIKVEKNQKIIDTGLYGIVRHPMYAITLLLFLTIPLILGSIISFIIFLIYPFLLVMRILNEEKVLEKELTGYKEYEKKVKYRLIPFIW